VLRVTGSYVVTDRNVPLYGGDGEPSSSLLVHARDGDPWAWGRLVSLTTPLVHRWCRCAGVPAADIPDVGQEVYWAVVGRLGAFRRDRPGDSFRGWLRTITQNKVRDYWRRKKAQLPAALGREASAAQGHWPPEEDSAGEDTDLAEEKRLLYQRAVELIQAEFEEKTWQAFWRVEIEEQAPAEVAADLGMSVNAVYLAKSRVRKRLRDEFADLLDEAPARASTVTK
jgi:RNA polymerase sigma-70 factor (ECF subfamily)